MITLVIFSGLPGAGKSALATQLARRLQFPIIRLDDVAGSVPRGAGPDYWDAMVSVTLDLSEAQLELGVSVIIDAVFMAYDRYHARQLAEKYRAAFRPIYVFISDESLWEKRVNERAATLKNGAAASWNDVLEQQKRFLPWEADTALFVDTAQPLEENFASVLKFVTEANVNLKPLSTDVPLTKGKYHQ